MTEVKIEAGAPYRVTDWRVTDEGDITGYVRWPTRITVGDKSIEVACWTAVGRNHRGWWQLSTNGPYSGLPRIRASRTAPGTTNISSFNDIVTFGKLEIEIGADFSPSETLTMNFRELYAFMAHVDKDHYIGVVPPNCSEAVCQKLFRKEGGEKE